MRILFVTLTALLISLSISARGWEKIGERRVNFLTEKDVINCSHKGKFRALKFKVLDAPVEFKSVNVEYLTGERQQIPIKQIIRKGGETRTIDLRGKRRIIKRIEFIYRSVKGWNNKNGRALIQIYGLE